MDILSIEGENIASLAKPFSIDLETGELAGCGLFAITGKTGAGKSSVLDAMCLALYGDYPRLGAAGVNDTVPDASGEDIQSNDPRTILRRGTAAGHAVVRFRGRDGVDYEATWSVRRARGKPTGRLQNQERSLKRLSDGQVLENQIRRMNERVVELTGLTYEEFRRSVLLAQGDFDSFLSAKTNERATILEKVTGTGLYREISRRVYAQHQDAEGKVNDLELKLGEHTVLSVEEKAGITGRQSTLAAHRKVTGTALKAIQVDLDHYTKLEDARVKLTAATKENEAAITAWTEAGFERDRLAHLRKAAGVRGEFREDRDARIAQTKATDELARIEANLEKVADEEVAARDVRDKAQETVDALEVRFRELGTIWSEAERLDARIEAAEFEHKTAAEEAGECHNVVKEASNEAQEKRTRRDGIVTAMEQKQTKIAAEKAGAIFKDRWDILHDRLGRRITCAVAQEKASDEALAIEKDIAGKRVRIKEIDGLVKGREAKKKALSEQRQAQTEERATIARRDPKQRLSRLMASRMAIRGLLELARSHKTKSEELRRHDEALAKLNGTRRQAEKDLTNSVAAIADAESRIKALEAPVEMAETAASREARELRRHLVDGEPCPVCQSTHHPLHDDAETAALALRLRADLVAARNNWTTQSRNKVTQEGIITDAKTRLASMEENRARMVATLDQVKADYARVATEETDGQIADQIPGAIADDAVSVIAGLEVLQGKLDGWKEALEAECKHLEDLDNALEDFRGYIETEEAAIAALRDERTGLVDAVGPQQNNLSRAESNRDKARDDIADLDAQLDNRIGDAEILGLTAWSNFSAGADDQLTELETRRAGYMSDLDTIQKAETFKAQLDTQIAILEGKEKSAREALGKAEEKAGTREETLDELRVQRAAMLDGQPTGAHRTAFNDSRKAAGEAHRKAAEVHGKAAETKAGLTASKASATEALGTARERADEAREALTAASQRIEIPLADLAELLSGEQAPIDDRIAQLEEGLGEIETRKIQADQDLTTRQKDLAAIDKAHSPEAAREILEDKKKNLMEQDEVHAKEEGDLKTQLALDAEARRKQAAIIKDLETAKRDRDTWAAVNDTVGSASGDRFSQIAQEVTLSILAEQANYHLAEIKPRYRLALGDGKLSLHVVDEDMAGEIRSTRSLSGGERFLVSLSLALALSSVGGTGAISGTLFIDEGFGTLDAESLELAIDALEALQAQGRTVGVISHVQAMKDRIPMQVQVQAQSDGSSEVVVAAS